MLSTYAALLVLSGYCLQAEAGLTAALAGIVVDNSKEAGVQLPGYVRMMASKSTGLSKSIHVLFGDWPERAAVSVIKTATDLMPNDSEIEDVLDVARFKLTEGKVTGLKHLYLAPGGEVDIIIERGFPAFVLPVQFTNLKISFKFEKVVYRLLPTKGYAHADVISNNIVLKFHFTPRFREWCYLTLYDVIFTDMDDLDFKVGSTDNYALKSGTLMGFFMDLYFATTDGQVEERIKKSISDVLYYEIPLASQAICDNKRRSFKVSDFRTEHLHTQESLKKAEMYKSMQEEGFLTRAFRML